MSELNQKTQGDIPAEQTLEYMRINAGRMAEFEGKIDNIDKKVDEVKSDVKQLSRDVKDGLKGFECMAREEHAKIYERGRQDKDQLDKKIDNKADQADYVFIRNLLILTIVASIFISIVIGVISNSFEK